MALLPRFLLAVNEKADPGAIYVQHTQQPRFTAKKINSNISEWGIVDDIDNMAQFFNYDASKVAGLMRRLSDWWVAYNK